jgi:cytochrome P450
MPERTPPSLLKLVNPVRPVLQWYYNRVIRNSLVPFIQQTLASQGHGNAANDQTKTIISLAAKAYLAEKSQTSSAQTDREFTSLAIPHLVMFLFAGHDTTATTLCFAYHLLHKNPSTLARLRAEHDEVLGPDPSLAESRITDNPQLLNALPYTTAVIKETLRHFAPAATVRQGQPGFYLVHPATGHRYPTDGLFVHQNSHTTHHLESIFPRAWEFLPERFLAAEGEELHVRKNAFRPFELGPRACIGQELALLELKMILVLTARVFEIESTYPEGMADGPGDFGTYQVGNVTGHPKGGMPVRVKLRG